MSNYLQALKKFNNSSTEQVFALALQDPRKKSLAMANLSSVITNYGLSECDPVSVATAVVQMTNLNFSASTGEMYIIPYGKNAQTQLGYKGWISLALRSKEIIKLHAERVYEGEYKGIDRLSGEPIFQWNENNNGKQVIGWFGYMKLKNGFEKTMYWTSEEMHLHFVKFSLNNYDEVGRRWMESKKKNIVSKILTVEEKSKITMLKQLISKWAPKDATIEMALNVDNKTYNEQGVGSYNQEESTSSNGRVPADKELIKNTLVAIGAIIKELNVVKNQTEAQNWVKEKAREAGIDFTVSSGWYGVTEDELKQLAIVVEAETGAIVIVNERRLSQEQPEAEKQHDITFEE